METATSNPAANRPRYGRATAITAALPPGPSLTATGSVTQPAPSLSRPPELPAKPVPPPKPKPAVAPKPTFTQPSGANQQSSALQTAAKPNFSSNTVQQTPANAAPAAGNQQPNNAMDSSASALHTSMISEFLRRPAPAGSKPAQPQPAQPPTNNTQQAGLGSTGTGHKSVSFKNLPQSDAQSGAIYQNAQTLMNSAPAQAKPPAPDPPSAKAADSTLNKPQPALPSAATTAPRVEPAAPAARMDTSTRQPAAPVANGNRTFMATSKSNLDDITTNIVEMDKAIDDVQFNIERIDSTLDELANYNKRFMTAIEQLSDGEEGDEEAGANQPNGANAAVEKRTDAAIRELLNSVDTLKRNAQQRPANSNTGSRSNLSRSNEQLLQPTQTAATQNFSNLKPSAASNSSSRASPRPGDKAAAGASQYTETNIDDEKSYDDSDSEEDKKAYYSRSEDGSDTERRSNHAQPVYANLPLASATAQKKPVQIEKKTPEKPAPQPQPLPTGPAEKLSVAQKARMFEAAANGQQINQPTSAAPAVPAVAPTPAPSAKSSAAPALPPRSAKSDAKPMAKPRLSKSGGNTSGSTELLGSSPNEPEYTNQATIQDENAQRRRAEANRSAAAKSPKGRADFVSEDELDEDEDDEEHDDNEDEYYNDDEIADAQYDDDPRQRLAARGGRGTSQKNAINESDVTATRKGQSTVPKGKYAVKDDGRVSGRPGSQLGQFRRTRSDHQLAARSSRQFAAVDSIELDSDEAYDDDDRETHRSAGGSTSNGSVDGKKGRLGPASRDAKGGSGGIGASMRSRRPLPRLPSGAVRPQSSEYSDLDLTAQPTYANQSTDLHRHSDLSAPQGDYMNTSLIAGRPDPKNAQQNAKVQRTRSRSVQDFQRLLKDDSRSRFAPRPRMDELSVDDGASTTASTLNMVDLHGLQRDEVERLIRSYLEDRKREKMSAMLRALMADRDRDETLRSLMDQYGDEMLDLVGGRSGLLGLPPQRAGTLGSLLTASANTFDRDRLGGRSERLNAPRPRDREELESVGASTLGIGPGYSSLRLPRGGTLGMSMGSINDADPEGRYGLSLIAPLRVLRAGPNDMEEPPPAMKPTPKPAPPVNRRAHLFETIGRFEELDRHVLQVTLSDDFLTFRSLVAELSRPCADDVERCRAIFRWVTTKDLSVVDIDPEGISPPDSLLGTLRAVKTGSKSYNELFRKMCIFAGIHCETIHGVSKGAGYTPGTNVKDNRMFRNTWTAVHLNGEWRIVNAAWGARHLLRYYKRKAAGEQTSLPTYSGSRSQLNLNRSVAGSQATLRSAPPPSRLGTLRADGTLIADGTQGLPKSDDFYFLPDAENYVYEHFPDKKVWQLLKRSITIEDFMRLPILKSNFFNAGLRLKKPYTETLDTRDGRVDIHIEMPRYVGLTATLLNRSDMVEVKGLTLVRTVGAGNECVVTCEPPKIGKYYLNIYVSENWKDDAFLGLTSGFELGCAFQVKCPDPNLDRLVIGRYPPNLGCLGKTPVADRIGLVPTREYSDPFIVHVDKEELRIGMLLLPGLKVQHQLTYFDRSGKQMQQCDQYALLQTRNKRAAYVIRCPADGYYLLTVYASELGGTGRVVDMSADDPAARTDDGTIRPGATSSQQLECVLRYLLDARKPAKVAAFPKQSSRWVGCYLLEPTTKQLYVDTRYVFRIVAPTCSSVSVVINAKTWLDLKPGREGVWEARISTGAELGELSVYAKFRSDSGDQIGSGATPAPSGDAQAGANADDKFVKLLDYEIVSAPVKTKK